MKIFLLNKHGVLRDDFGEAQIDTGGLDQHHGLSWDGSVIGGYDLPNSRKNVDCIIINLIPFLPELN